MGHKVLPNQKKHCIISGACLGLSAPVGLCATFAAGAAACLSSGMTPNPQQATKAGILALALTAAAAGLIFAGYRLGNRYYRTKASHFVIGVLPVILLTFGSAVALNHYVQSNRTETGTEWKWEGKAPTVAPTPIKLTTSQAPN